MKTRALLAAALCIVIFSGISAGEELKSGTLTGILQLKNGQPMVFGMAFLFERKSGPPPAPEKYWRVSDLAIPLDEAGKFTVRLPEGTYTVGGIKRSMQNEIGPPHQGDHFLTMNDDLNNPVYFAVKPGETVDIGVVAEGVPFTPEMTAERPETTGVKGTILDSEGKPVAGVLVFGYLTPDMVGRPLFVSERSGADGRYLLRVSHGGVYYLNVRDAYGGGPPAEGAVVGDYGGKEPIPVVVRNNEVVRGFDIKSRRFTRKSGNKRDENGRGADRDRRESIRTDRPFDR